MLILDGSMGEGGGQILRTSLSLSLVTGRPFTLRNIRARRKNPGLQRQHLAAVRAAAEVGAAEVKGDQLGSAALVFKPGPVRPGSYRFATGTAGSATLVFQTVLPPLLSAAGPSTLVLEGGTHNPMAPPFDFLDKSFLPILNRMGPSVTARLRRRGFYPAGGGECRVEIRPAPLRRLDLPERGEVRSKRAVAVVSRLPADIARRELAVLEEALGIAGTVEEDRDSRGPGNVVLVEIASDAVTEVAAGFGRKGVRAEVVAQGVADEVRRYLAAGVPVGEHLADQLLLPMAMAGGGRFRTLPPTGHTTTNLEVVRTFLGTTFTLTEEPGACAIEIR